MILHGIASFNFQSNPVRWVLSSPLLYTLENKAERNGEACPRHRPTSRSKQAYELGLSPEPVLTTSAHCLATHMGFTASVMGTGLEKYSKVNIELQMEKLCVIKLRDRRQRREEGREVRL